MNKDKILIFGRGFIGSRIQEEFKCKITDRGVHSFRDVQEEITKYSPEIIINCIGYTGEKNVDDCERDLDKTLMANTFIPILLAEIALRNNIRLIHISSGCIYHFDYSKDTPIFEEKIPDYFDLYYSRTKIYSEQALKILTKKYPILIIRIRIPLDDRAHPKNILTKLINYKRVINIPNSITYLPDLTKALEYLIEIQAQGIFNVVNRGTLRYPELLDIYRRYVPDFEYEIIDFKDLNLVRTNLILSIKKLEESGFRIRDIHEVLEECVQNYIRY